MAHTGSGFPIGFRRGWSEWQKDLGGVIGWAKENGFSFLDVGRDGDEAGRAVIDAGMKIGSVDLKEWTAMISADRGRRAEAIAKNEEYVKACAVLGSVNHFIVMLPEKADLPRSENFAYMVESFGALASVLEESRARVVVEGWPGPGALCCTPEGCREFFKACPSSAMGINYDPSHLIRMGIDPIRFLREFVDRVYHVHGKDTALFPEELYQFGNFQPPTLAAEIPFGSRHWRYTIPGHGGMDWVEAFRILKECGYAGGVSIELEDAHFNGKDESEKRGLILGREYLEGC